MSDPYNKNRCAIFNYLTENPGSHFSAIMRALGLTKRGLGYHMKKLVDEGLVVFKAHGIFKFYYLPGAEIRRPLTPTQQEIVDLVREEPCSMDEIAEILDKSISATDYHLKNLVILNIIRLNDDYYYQIC